jgi:hypothetical protein
MEVEESHGWIDGDEGGVACESQGEYESALNNLLWSTALHKCSRYPYDWRSSSPMFLFASGGSVILR